jgi:hypothetical protein
MNLEESKFTVQTSYETDVCTAVQAPFQVIQENFPKKHEILSQDSYLETFHQVSQEKYSSSCQDIYKVETADYTSNSESTHDASYDIQSVENLTLQTEEKDPDNTKKLLTELDLPNPYHTRALIGDIVPWIKHFPKFSHVPVWVEAIQGRKPSYRKSGLLLIWSREQRILRIMIASLRKVHHSFDC